MSLDADPEATGPTAGVGIVFPRSIDGQTENDDVDGSTAWIHLHCPFPASGRIAAMDVHRVAAFLEHAPRPIVVVCDDGLSKTGVALAAGLIARGSTSREALAAVRSARPGSCADPELLASVED